MSRDAAAARRIFISHATYDILVAKVLRDVLGRAGVGHTFLDADDLRPGDHWMPDMRSAITECDALVAVITPEFKDRLWMAAEWACFWVAEKPTYVLRLQVGVAGMFEPMRSAVTGDLSSRSSMTAFLDTVADGGYDNYRLATALVERVGEARVEQAAGYADAQFERLITSRGSVPDEVVLALIAVGREDDLASLHEQVDQPGTNITRPRLHRVAQLLIRSGTPSESLVPLVRAIGNSNYQRDAVIAVLNGAEPLPSRQAFADALFDCLSTVARQRVVRAARDLGVQLTGRWDGIEPFGR
jgi:hypothetical protein